MRTTRNLARPLCPRLCRQVVVPVSETPKPSPKPEPMRNATRLLAGRPFLPYNRHHETGQILRLSGSVRGMRRGGPAVTHT